MSLIVNTNVGSLNAQRSLAASGAELKTAMERLSSGKKINSAADDAAGFAIAERMTAQIRGLNMATKNANDGLSMLAVIENATNDVTDMLHRMRELAVQAANDTNGLEDRTFLQKEVSELIKEIDRVATQTQYNNQLVLNGSFQNKSIQVGTEAGQTVQFDIQSIKTEDLGPGNYVATVEGIQIGGPGDTHLSINVEGKVTDIIIEEGAGNGLGMVVDRIYQSGIQGVKVTYAEPPAVTGANQGFRFTVEGAKTLTVSSNSQTVTSSGTYLALEELEGSAVASFVGYDPFSNTEGTNEFKQTKIFDSQTNGAMSAVQVGDFVAFGNDPTKYFKVESIISGASGEDGIIVDGAPDFPAQDLLNSKIYLAKASKTLGEIDLSTNASEALNIVSASIEHVASDRAAYGALQNRLEYTVSNLMNVAEFTTSARSRIEDADFAAESARLAKAQVLQQTGTAMLAQANAQPQLVLSLIQ